MFVVVFTGVEHNLVTTLQFPMCGRFHYESKHINSVGTLLTQIKHCTVLQFRLHRLDLCQTKICLQFKSIIWSNVSVTSTLYSKWLREHTIYHHPQEQMEDTIITNLKHRLAVLINLKRGVFHFKGKQIHDPMHPSFTLTRYLDLFFIYCFSFKNQSCK